MDGKKKVSKSVQAEQITKISKEKAQELFDDFFTDYVKMSEKIKGFPIPDSYKSIVIKEFDTGFLWLKEAFNIIATQ